MKNTAKSKNILPSDACDRLDRERRCGQDRRQDIRSKFRYYLINGRRESARREEDRTRVFFFDRYNQRIFAAITAILMLSIFDGLLTLILIEKGASELNPVMAFFLEYGPMPFIIAKYILTSFGVVLLLIVKNVFINRISMYAHSLFTCVIFAFSSVIVWELYLLFTVL
ncbi:DUF5658 family protein [bacterium]|nr:DUF5658 family protein [bacterium]